MAKSQAHKGFRAGCIYSRVARDEILALIKIVDHGWAVKVHETEHGATLLL